VVGLYFDRGDGRRYRSLGCAPCTRPVESPARTADDIVEELASGLFSHVAERSGRAQDAADGGLETLRREGYM
jgi:sulfate adenylyltransferase subunit 2